MPKIYPEAMLFCLLWAALAFYGFSRVGLMAGIALSVGLFLIIMPASMVTLSRTGSLAIERGVRWGILIAAGLVLLSVSDLGGSGLDAAIFRSESQKSPGYGGSEIIPDRQSGRISELCLHRP